MKEYVVPSADFIGFEKERVLTASGVCRCYLDIGTVDDYDAAGSPCWRDSEDAIAYDMHDAGV